MSKETEGFYQPNSFRGLGHWEKESQNQSWRRLIKTSPYVAVVKSGLVLENPWLIRNPFTDTVELFIKLTQNTKP